MRLRRYSVPFFFQPKVDAMIEPWVADNEVPRYEAFSWQQYIRGRVTDNFADYGVEDIQIERYRVASPRGDVGCGRFVPNVIRAGANIINTPSSPAATLAQINARKTSDDEMSCSRP